jgi:hypothetical protein
MTPVTIILKLPGIIVVPAKAFQVLNFSRIEFGSLAPGQLCQPAGQRACHLVVMWARSP